MTTVTMPQLGETVVEGTITKWLKQEGDHVDQDEPLFEISTDKVDTEVPSPAAGTLTKILVQEGQTVSVKTPIAEINGAGQAAGAGPSPDSAQQPAQPESVAATGGAPPDSAREQAEPPTAAAPQSQPQRGAGPGFAPPAAAPPPAAPASPVAPAAPAPASQIPDRGPRSQIISPLVRRLAEENGVDLSQVIGTGTGGRITKNDVMAFAVSRETAAPGAQPAAEPTVPAPATTPPAPVPEAVPEPQAAQTPAVARGSEEVVPMTVVRKAIAEHMTRSLQVSARAWNMVEVDMEKIARIRSAAKEAFTAREGFNLTYMPFLARAVVDALLANPLVNSELRGEEIVVKHYVNLGIAVSYDQGLIVPVVKGADGMNLIGLARAINDLATRARVHQLKPDEVHEGTFTITNPGPFGSILSVPIINQPQTGILAFDAVVKRPVVIDDAIAVRHMVYVSMSWDHRVIDGALASQFLGRIKENMETWDWTEDLGL
ncbi:MAG TPA: 2-oxoglutarate dehydrogenase, E2 component, dihydrolipoamide succinyltransferase [Actinomycetota bacterium]|nr:2-oxoglutarate dehydrogenase, E2 component, dihydrolipoamide succinyltransferase [Actinomycetota bacterium]